jgi:hypothetical protein
MNVLLPFKIGLIGLYFTFILFFGCCAVSAAELIKDPTRPLVDLNSVNGQASPLAEEEETPLILHSVVAKEQYKVAVINNRVLKVGEIIEGYEIIAITDYTVELIRDGKGMLLSLFSLDIKNKIENKIRNSDNE